MEYLKITYRNSCDLGGTVFSAFDNAFRYTIFLPVDIGQGSYELKEEGREDGDGNFVRDFGRLQREYTFELVVPEYTYDALAHVQLHDTIFITTRYDENSRAFNFKVSSPEWQNKGGVCKITISFSVDYIVNTGCCQTKALTYERCLTCNSEILVDDLIDSTDPIFDEHVSDDLTLFNTIVFCRFYMVRFTTLNGVVTYQLYQYALDVGAWTYYVGSQFNGAVCFTHAGIAWHFYYNGSSWQPYQVISSIANVAATVVVKGYCLPNTWAQLQVSTDGITYVNTGAVTSGTIFSTLGIAMSGLTVGTLYYFRFRLFNNNCNYGYSNVLTITKT